MFAEDPDSANTPTDRQRPNRTDGRPQTIDASDLLKDTNEVRIANGGEVYTLRRTKSGKLILYK
ncbi:MAG: hemin uptake protein HemP [Pirellulales bacterium]|nr:hemin uptake protein HemP [Pirellulales bacterium]